MKGTVIDKTGESVIGASIQVKGTTQGTITDIDGKFSLGVPDKKIRYCDFFYWLCHKRTPGGSL